MMHFIAKLAALSPPLSLAIVILLPQWLEHRPNGAPVRSTSTDAVTEAVASLSYTIGPWVGRDVPVPEAAVKLLRPNALVGRQYRNLDSGIVMDLVLVHCGDARDMLGHYPPICYPNAGWQKTAPDHAAVELQLLGRSFAASHYTFSRPSSSGAQRRIRLFNFFVLADGTLSHDIHDVRARTNSLGATIGGVAQVQLLTDEACSLDDARAAAVDLLDGTAALFEALGVSRDE